MALPAPLARSTRAAVIESLVQGFILLVILSALLPGVFFRGELLSSADILFQIEPWSHYAPADYAGPNNPLMVDPIAAFRPYHVAMRAAWADGEWPLWNAFAYFGMPLLANCQSAVFYPPMVLHAILGVDAAMSWLIVLKLWLCGMTAFVCGRALGMSRSAAAFFSFAWMLGGYNWVWAFWPLPDVSAWVPVVFLGVERIRAGVYRSGIFTLALGGTLLLFAGHPETAFAFALGIGAYFALQTVMAWPGGAVFGRQIGALTVGWGLALAVTLPMTLPFVEYLLNSSTFFSRHAGHSVPPLDAEALNTFFVPRFLGTHADGNYIGDHDTNRYFMIHVGIAIWLFAALGVAVNWRDKVRRKEAIALGIPAIAGLFIAFGAWPLGVLNSVQPFASLLPTYNACLFVFAWPLLAARGVDAVAATAPRWRSLMAPAAVLLAGAAIVWAFYTITIGLFRSAGMEGYIHGQVLIAAAGAGAALGLMALAKLNGLRTIAGPLACLLVLAELAIAGRGLNPSLPPEQVYPETQLFTYLRDAAGPVRVDITTAGIPSGLGTSYGVEESLGYDGLFPARVIDYLEMLSTDVWINMEPMAAKTYYLENELFRRIVPEGQGENWEEVTVLDGVRVMRDPGAMPRAIVVPQAEFIGDREALFARMVDPAFDPRETALLESPLAPMPAGGRGEARVLDRTTASMTIEANSDAPALLVLAEAWYPGWRAEVDGAEAPVVPVNRVFRGVPIPAGTHTVTLTYFPWTFRVGLAVSCAALLGTCAYGGLLLRSRRRSAIQSSVQ